MIFKINEEASDKVLEVEQKYNEVRKPVYDKRNEIIKSIPDFWLTAVSIILSNLSSLNCLWTCCHADEFHNYFFLSVSYDKNNCFFLNVQFLSHPALCELLTEEDQKVWFVFLFLLFVFSKL